MTRPTILIAEDNHKLLSSIENFLLENGFYTLTAASGSRALSQLKTSDIDMVLLDLDLGDMNGMEILGYLRKRDPVRPPVIIISSTSNVRTKTQGFSTGCDDYIVKPFFLEELLMRIRRLFSRMEDTLQDRKEDLLQTGVFRIDRKNRAIYKNGVRLPDVRNRLFRLLEYFLLHPHQIVSKGQIKASVWDDSLDPPSENTLLVHISELRQLIEEHARKPEHLVTVTGRGYRFSP